MKRLGILVCWMLWMGIANAQTPNPEVLAYIEQYKGLAIEEMQRSGVPATIKLAQGILETQAGKGDLVNRSNNHFGIKCKTNWNGEKVYHDDDANGECFRKYPDAATSYRDHSLFLRNNGRYAFLFELNPEDYAAWAHGLKKAGYATNPKYAPLLIKLIEDYQLQQYSLMALGKLPYTPGVVAPVVDPSTNNASPVAESASAKPIFPSGIFHINETKVIFAAKGTAWLAIANKYNLDAAQLLSFNDLESGDILGEDQLVFLQRKRRTGTTDKRVVRAGETAYQIAQAEGMRLENLLSYNHLKHGAALMPGSELYLTAEAPISTAPTVPLMAKATATNLTLHTVQPKETLYGIARNYNVSVQAIQQLNGLTGYDLSVGQQLKIPQ